MTGEEVEEEGEEGGGGVAACAKDMECFRAQDVGIGSLFR